MSGPHMSSANVGSAFVVRICRTQMSGPHVRIRKCRYAAWACLLLSVPFSSVFLFRSFVCSFSFSENTYTNTPHATHPEREQFARRSLSIHCTAKNSDGLPICAHNKITYSFSSHFPRPNPSTHPKRRAGGKLLKATNHQTKVCRPPFYVAQTFQNRKKERKKK